MTLRILLKTVSIPLKRRQKYLSPLQSWVPGAEVSLKECRSVVNCLQHCALVISHGWSHLPSFHKLVSSFKDNNKPFIRHRIPSSVLTDVSWWKDILSSDQCSRVPGECLRNSIFVDASTSFGIGVLLDGRWLAWKLLPDWRSDGRCIGWAEMVAIDLGLRTLIHNGFKDCHLLLHSDNQGVVRALGAGRSRSPAQNEILDCIVSNFRDHNIWLSVKWVKSEDNIADSISRGIFPTPRSRSRCGHPPPLPPYLKTLVQLV